MPFWPLQVYAYMYHREPNLGVHRENLTPGGWVLKEFVWEILFHCKTWMSIKLILKLKLPHLVSMCVSLPLQQFQCDPPIHPFITSFYGWSCMGNDDPNPNCHKPAVTENPATVTPKQIYTYPPPPPLFTCHSQGVVPAAGHLGDSRQAWYLAQHCLVIPVPKSKLPFVIPPTGPQLTILCNGNIHTGLEIGKKSVTSPIWRDAQSQLLAKHQSISQ